MLGTFGWQDGATGTPFISFTNLAGYTWLTDTDALPDQGLALWTALSTSGTPGRIWSENLYAGPCHVAPFPWDNLGGAGHTKGPGWLLTDNGAPNHTITV